MDQTKNGVNIKNIGICMDSNQYNFQLQKFAISENVAEGFFSGGGC